VQGAAGMKMHSAHFAATLARAARDRGALVIFDEVAVGLGRTGTLFATEQVGVVPDLLALAKGLAGGYLPLAATLATDAVYEAFLAPFADFRQLFHGHTFTGNPLACAAALASLDLFAQRDVLAHVALVSDRLARALASLSDPRVAAVRQCGVLVGIDLRRSDGSCFTPAHRAGHRAAMAARGHGAIVRPLGDTLVLNPPLAVTLDEVDHLVRAAAAGIATLP
jgi:adenosylmethionine-8-amino-7-oxononanoate aminotransferase